jgi:hypothetical protein
MPLKSGGSSSGSSSADSDAPYGPDQRPATLVTVLPDGTQEINAVRWSKTGDTYNWDVSYINPSALEDVFWGQNEGGVGHAFLVFKFKDGGFYSSRQGAYASKYLVVSVEAREKVGQGYSPVAGEFKTYKIVWNLSTLESYAYDTALAGKRTFDLFPFKVTQDEKNKMLLTALSKSVADHSSEYYNTLADNCVINALHTVDSSLPSADAVHQFLPVMGTRMLEDKGLLGAQVQFTATDPSGGGFVEPK